MARLPSHSEKKRLLLLGAGAAAGLVLAAMELVGRPPARTDQLPDHVIARVGGRDIPLERYRSVVGDLEADRRDSLTAEDLDFALQRLVDEELLVMEGIRLGVAESLPEVRKAVVRAVIAQTAVEAEAVTPTEKQLRELYGADPGFFTSAARYRVLWLRGPASAERNAARAAEVKSLLDKGAAPDAFAEAAGFERVTELPDVPLPLGKLRDYLGPELANALQELPPAAATGPLTVEGRMHVLYVAERISPRLPPFEEIRPQVEAEFIRRTGDAALRRQLARLRRETEIVVDSGKVAPP